MQSTLAGAHTPRAQAGARRPGRQRQRDPSDQRNNTRPLMQHPARSRPERRITTRSCTDSSTFADRSTRYPRRTYRRSTALSPRDAHIRARGRPGRAASWPPAAFPSRPAARLWQLPLLGCRCVGQLGWLILRRFACARPSWPASRADARDVCSNGRASKTWSSACRLTPCLSLLPRRGSPANTRPRDRPRRGCATQHAVANRSATRVRRR
jgi:hypothetical protein